jgi:hypothetical protein
MSDNMNNQKFFNAVKQMFNKRACHGKFGYAPINEPFTGAHFHHLHLEDDHSFGVYVPDFLHAHTYHNSCTGQGMDEMNAVALQYWLDDELYTE